MKQYDLIVANFPFSEGEKHALKCLEMQEGTEALSIHIER